jgi:hypothetical protein
MLEAPVPQRNREIRNGALTMHRYGVVTMRIVVA